MFQSEFQIKKCKEFLKAGTKLLEGDNYSDEDRKFFNDAKKANLAAEGLIDDREESVRNQKRLLLLVQYIQLCNKLMFLVFRKGKYLQLEEQYRQLISVEEVAKAYEDAVKKTQEKREEIQKLIDADREVEHRLDVFRGVLNGMSVEQAEEGLKKYEAQAKQAIAGK